MKKALRFFSAIAIAFIFIVESVAPAYAAQLLLPEPGSAVALSGIQFAPSLLRGLQINPNDPLRLDFIISKGEDAADQKEFTTETINAVKYFLAALTVPEKDLWVNLSPYEKNRIMPDGFAKTAMGRDLLEQDYVLKQLSASLLSPDTDSGKQFWSEIYRAASEKTGSTDIPIDSFHKIWIMPKDILIYENQKGAMIVESSLQVKLEEDLVAAGQLSQDQISSVASESPATTDLMRRVVVPLVEKEVNQGKHFAVVRQIYHAVALAQWYKMRLKESILGKLYADQGKTLGIDINDPAVRERVYQQYLEAFKRGAVNTIKEEADPTTGEMLPRKYFSGGVVMNAAEATRTTKDSSIIKAVVLPALSIASFSLALLSTPPAQGAITPLPTVLGQAAGVLIPENITASPFKFISPTGEILTPVAATNAPAIFVLQRTNSTVAGDGQLVTGPSNGVLSINYSFRSANFGGVANLDTNFLRVATIKTTRDFLNVNTNGLDSLAAAKPSTSALLLAGMAREFNQGRLLAKQAFGNVTLDGFNISSNVVDLSGIGKTNFSVTQKPILENINEFKEQTALAFGQTNWSIGTLRTTTVTNIPGVSSFYQAPILTNTGAVFPGTEVYGIYTTNGQTVPYGLVATNVSSQLTVNALNQILANIHHGNPFYANNINDLVGQLNTNSVNYTIDPVTLRSFVHTLLTAVKNNPHLAGPWNLKQQTLTGLLTLPTTSVSGIPQLSGSTLLNVFYSPFISSLDISTTPGHMALFSDFLNVGLTWENYYGPDDSVTAIINQSFQKFTASNLQHKLTPRDFSDALDVFNNGLAWDALTAANVLNFIDWQFHNNSLLGVGSYQAMQDFLVSLNGLGYITQDIQTRYNVLLKEISAQIPGSASASSAGRIENLFAKSWERTRGIAQRTGLALVSPGGSSTVNAAQSDQKVAVSSIQGGIKLDQINMRLEYDGENFKMPTSTLVQLEGQAVTGVTPVFIGIKPFDFTNFISLTSMHK
ncbi:MAG: hypothetical protein HQL19_00980 [Candidatus Omnitrophica bacterium]|nr:hypothetical protein [Candidatus Omnitrophota bacterium]